jgi:hypothetical protein
MRSLNRILALAILTSGSLAPGMVLADSIARASQKDIEMLLHAATGTNSAYRAVLIGETPGRVYFEYVTGLHSGSLFSNTPRHVVYWLPRSEISEEQLARFRDYKSRQEFRK